MKTRTPLATAPAINQDHQGAPFFRGRTGAGGGWVTSSEGVSAALVVLGATGGAVEGGGAGAGVEGVGAGAVGEAGVGAGPGPAGGGAAGRVGTGAGAPPLALSAATLPVARSTVDSRASAEMAPF